MELKMRTMPLWGGIVVVLGGLVGVDANVLDEHVVLGGGAFGGPAAAEAEVDDGVVGLVHVGRGSGSARFWTPSM